MKKMEAASRDQLSAIPSRVIPPAILPRMNVPNQRSPSPSHGNSNGHPMSNIGFNTPNFIVRAQSDTFDGSMYQSVASDLYMCPMHKSRSCSLVCIDCIELLCDVCIEPEDHKHKDCVMTYTGHSVKSICDHVKTSLTRKMSETKHLVNGLSESLTRKKDRMIAKKSETLTEIDRFYQRLKARILAKLQREENELLTYLQTTVAEQASSLTDKIQQCSRIIHDSQQRNIMLDNLDKLHSTTEHTTDYLKALLSTAVDVNKESRSIDEITAARDAFMVIRFLVNSGSEQSILSTKVASVEVLDSRSDSPDGENIEAEHINEVFSSTGAESSGSVESIVTIDRFEQEQTGSANDLRIASSDQSTSDIDNANLTAVSTHDQSRSSSVMSNSSRNVENSDNNSPRPSLENPNVEDDSEESEEEPPPPYPGLPTYIRSSDGTLIPEEEPPPYPGLPPPNYTQHPEPQTPHVPLQWTGQQATHRYRLGAVSDGQMLSQTLQLTSMNVSLPTSGNTPRSAFPAVIRPRGPLSSFSINEITDKRSSGIFSIAVYNDNLFLVVDRWNRKLKFLDDKGKSFGGLIFREEPWDITKMAVDMFAVTVPKLMIIYKVKASPEAVVTVGNVSTPKGYACIAHHAPSKLFVCGQVPQFGQPSVDVIGVGGGPVLISFRTNTLGQDLFSYPRYVKVADNGTVTVCDWNLKSLVVFKLDGTVVGSYKGSQDFSLSEPSGIELDKETNTMYVIDTKQSDALGRLHSVSVDCRCEKVYQGRNLDFRDARAIAVYRQHRVAVGSKNGILSIFSLREPYR